MSRDRNPPEKGILRPLEGTRVVGRVVEGIVISFWGGLPWRQGEEAKIEGIKGRESISFG